MLRILRNFLLFATIFALVQGIRREGRWFRETVTETVVEHQMVTTLVPSSCVKLEPSLPACRLAKYMDFDTDLNDPDIKITRTQSPGAMQTMYERALESSTSEIGWAEYLGIVAPTVTQTLVELHTETYMDPRYVITFSIKGCRPSKLPVENPCPLGPTMVPTISTTSVSGDGTLATSDLETINNLTSSGLEKKIAST